MNSAGPEDELAAFYADPVALRQALAVTAPGYRDAVVALVRDLAALGIKHSRIEVEDFQVFSHERLRTLLDDFIAAHPAAPQPLERIVVSRFARAGRAARDLNVTSEQLLDQLLEIAHLSDHCNIEVRLHLFVEAFDAEAAEGIAYSTAAASVDTVGFYYTFPDTPDAAAIAALRAELAAAIREPILRRHHVVWGNFPFCFFPADSFRVAYREAIAPLIGHIGAQRDLVRKLAAHTPGGPAPCARCRCRAACHAYTDVAAHPALAPHLQPRPRNAVVFAGGSVARQEAPPDPALIWTGPADQGSMLAAVLDGFDTILLVDGYFHARFPCTTAEVMLALEAGVRVLGGASIGALRALELACHGAEGVGDVLERLRKFSIKPYHWVAQTYDDADRPHTAPPVQALEFLDAAQSGGALDPDARTACEQTLETIPFLELTLDRFLLALPPGDVRDRLTDFRASRPADAFDIKRRDALLLLETYQRTAHDHDRAAARHRFRAHRGDALQRIFDLYRGDPDLALAADAFTGSDLDGGATQDQRTVAPAETCARARRFFERQDTTVADLSRYDPSGQHVISVFFPALYHLDYYPSSATGSGPVRDEALAAAYMELVERIPAGALHIHQRSRAEWGCDPYPAERLPQFYNWGTEPGVHEKVIADHGYVRVSELNSGRKVLIPKAAIMFAYSGSDGLAAGNTVCEATLYGLFELIERDTGQMHLIDPVLRARRAEFLLDPRGLDDPLCAELLAEADRKTLCFLLYELPNSFGLPCVMCEAYDIDRSIQIHGGIAVRADLRSAARAALREAYLQHITYFAGTRDDYRAFTHDKRARLAFQHYIDLHDRPKARQPALTATAPPRGVSALLRHTTDALARGGLHEILVADTSPHPHSQLKSVKVIVPGLDLWFCPDFQPSVHLRERAAQVRRQLGWLDP